MPLYWAHGDDCSVYLVSAQSLAKGAGYRLINDPALPPATHYPIGYPALLAVPIGLLGITPLGVTLARILSTIAGLITLYFGYRLLRLYATEKTAALLTLAIGLSPMLVKASGNIMSEAVYMAFSVGAVLYGENLLRRFSASPARGFVASLPWLVLGVFVGASLLIRTVGVALVLGAGLAILLRRWWLPLLQYSVGVLLTATPFYFWQLLQPRDHMPSYLDQIKADSAFVTPFDQMAGTVRNFLAYAAFPAYETRTVLNLAERFHLNWLLEGFLWGIGLLLALLCLIGFVPLLRRGSIVGFYMVFYTTIILLCPWDPRRYMFPLLPLLVVALTEGGRIVLGRFTGQRWAGVVSVAVVGVVLVAQLMVDANWLRSTWKDGNYRGDVVAAQWDKTLKAYNWVRQNTPPDAQILSTVAYASYLFTERKTLSLAYEATVETLADKVPAGVPVYLFVYPRQHYLTGEELSQAYVRNYLEKYPNGLELVYGSPSGNQEWVQIYRLTGRGEGQ
jgi:4-amino-4-deoxy-L-arabinose transferase-like glycosyltransferase